MFGDRKSITAFAALVFGLLALVAMSARAVTVADLYEVTLPIEGNRETAFSEALKAVAVRVSGQRDAASRLGSAVNSPRQYVQRFAFTSDDQLQVAFDAGSIDRLLNGAGLPIWGRERPATLVLLNVPAPDGLPTWLEANYPSPDRDALARVAKQRGVPLVWPVLSPQDRSLLSGASSASAAELMQLARQFNANAVLLGQARRDANGALNVHWTLASNDGVGEAHGALEAGAHLAADTFGRTYAASGTSLRSVSVEVAGIDTLDDYAVALNYLEGMTLVRSVALEQVSGNKMRFALAVRGDARTLRRALALDNRLVPSGENTPGTEGLQLRFQR